MAVQGGLLASAIATREKEDANVKKGLRHGVGPTAAFVAAKFTAYALLGFMLGAFGGVLTLSDTVRSVIQFIAGIYMIAVALDLLQVHPIFHYAILQPPRFLIKMVRNQAKSKDVFAPALLGAMTIFIPCGTTLAMEALAISSGSAVAGALIMAAFILGTTPLFFGLGIITTVLGDTTRRYFFKLAGVIVIYLGVISITGALNALGHPLSLSTIAGFSPIEINLGSTGGNNQNTSLAQIVDGKQVVNIQVRSDGYTPNLVWVKSGIPVRINLTAGDVYSCASEFTIPQYGISKQVPNNGSVSVEFTPTKTGKILFTCVMGMYTGTIEVI